MADMRVVWKCLFSMRSAPNGQMCLTKCCRAMLFEARKECTVYCAPDMSVLILGPFVRRALRPLNDNSEKVPFKCLFRKCIDGLSIALMSKTLCKSAKLHGISILYTLVVTRTRQSIGDHFWLWLFCYLRRRAVPTEILISNFNFAASY